MTEKRYQQLSKDDTAELMPHEIKAGWHFCLEFDGLLVGPGMSELNFCGCLDEDHPVYKTVSFLDDCPTYPPF